MTAIRATDAARQVDDPQALKALAHPLRQRLWRLLMQGGPATVGTLVTHTGRDPGQVSYHLRELAKGGWVAPAAELARDRRESWWQAVVESTRWSTDDFATPAEQALAQHLSGQLIAEDLQALRRFRDSARQWSKPWQDASTHTRAFLNLTAEEAQSMLQELNEVLQRWGEVGKPGQTGQADPDRQPYLLFLHGFPDADHAPEVTR